MFAVLFDAILKDDASWLLAVGQERGLKDRKQASNYKLRIKNYNNNDAKRHF